MNQPRFSLQKYPKIAARILLILLFFLLFFSVVKEGWRYWKVSQRLTQKKLELRVAETENQELQAKFKEAQGPEFVFKQARELFGLEIPAGQSASISPGATYGDLRVKEEVPKYIQWWNLFVY